MRGELILPDDEEAIESYRVAIHAKAKHADLWPLVQKLGSNKALAEKLNVSQQTIGLWINLKAVPNFIAKPTVWGPRIDILGDLTGKTFDELWPPALRKAIGEGKAAVEKTIMMENATTAYAIHTSERMALPPHKPVEDDERAALLLKLLDHLDARYRRVIELRYLEGQARTLDEVARIIGITRERIRQIEVRAIDKLQKKAQLLGIHDLLDWGIE